MYMSLNFSFADTYLYYQRYLCINLTVFTRRLTFIITMSTDHIAIPDFNSGAMENWGLITYREALLYNDMSTASDLSWIAEVISHELAHMVKAN